jgi:hypothetical protein
MTFRIISVLIVAFHFISTNAQTNRVVLKTSNLTEQNYIKADDFYLTHYIYLDLFLRESLLLDATKDEVLKVINSIKKYSSAENPLVFEITKTENIKYKITVVIIEKDDKEILVFFTNWNPQLKEFEDAITDDSYTRWYYLNGDKLTYRKSVSKEIDYEIIEGARLANAYLFDELGDNDALIENLISNIDKDDTIENYLYAMIVKLKYYVFKRDKTKVDNIIETLNDKFEENKDNLSVRGLQSAFETTLFQIELMK